MKVEGSGRVQWESGRWPWLGKEGALVFVQALCRVLIAPSFSQRTLACCPGAGKGSSPCHDCWITDMEFTLELRCA